MTGFDALAVGVGAVFSLLGGALLWSTASMWRRRIPPTRWWHLILVAAQILVGWTILALVIARVTHPTGYPILGALLIVALAVPQWRHRRWRRGRGPS